MSVKTVKAIINGVTTTLTLNKSTGKYEATVTAPAKSSYPLDGHYYPVTVQAVDDAGNVTTVTDKDAALGESLRLQVKEKVAPVSTITYPTASAAITNNKPIIKWTVKDDDSGVDPATISITIDAGSKVSGDAITKKVVTGGYECSYEPAVALADGNHTIKVDGRDFDGNAAVQKSVTFKVDTVPPTLSVTSPVDGYVTNTSSVNVAGKTNDATSSPVTVTIKLNDGAAENVTVSADGAFSKSATLRSGTNTITVVARDSAGKTSTVVRTVVLDTGAPVIHSVKLTPNPVDAGKTYIISVDVTD